MAASKAIKGAEVSKWIKKRKGWTIRHKAITKLYRFEDYYDTMAFVNALAWVSHREDHHPDLEVRYNRCRVTYITHSVGGVSWKDFTCAEQADGLVKDLASA